jgi:hypothetical protein
MRPPLSALAESLHRFDPPWIEVGRVYRRICFLRSEGLAREARLAEESEFAQAAAKARDLAASESEADSLLRALMSEEEERVAEAVAFAEVLVPVLARRLSENPPAARQPAIVRTPRRPAAEAPDAVRGIDTVIQKRLADDGYETPKVRLAGQASTLIGRTTKGMLARKNRR